MSRASQDGRGPRKGAFWVDEIGRTVGRAALLATVSVLPGSFANRTGPLHKSIGQERIRFRIEELSDIPLGDQGCPTKGRPELGAECAIFRTVSAAIVVE